MCLCVNSLKIAKYITSTTKSIVFLLLHMVLLLLLLLVLLLFQLDMGIMQYQFDSCFYICISGVHLLQLMNQYLSRNLAKHCIESAC